MANLYHKRYPEKNRELNRRYRETHREWFRAYDRRYRKMQVTRNQAWVAEYLRSHPCVDCGETDPVVLDFDHVRGEKLGTVCQFASQNPRSLKTLIAEIDKCEVRCANCHRRRHAKTKRPV